MLTIIQLINHFKNLNELTWLRKNLSVEYFDKWDFIADLECNYDIYLSEMKVKRVQEIIEKKPQLVEACFKMEV